MSRLEKQFFSSKEKLKSLKKNYTASLKKKTAREAVALFDDPDKLQAAFEDLQSNGFMMHELSVLAGENIIQEKFGHAYRNTRSAEDDPKAPRALYVQTESINIAKGAAVAVPLFIAATTTAAIVIASGGATFDVILYASMAGAVAAGIGSMLSMFIAQHRARYLQSQLRRGGLPLWVNIRSREMERRAIKILHKYAAQDVHVHDIQVDQ